MKACWPARQFASSRSLLSSREARARGARRIDPKRYGKLKSAFAPSVATASDRGKNAPHASLPFPRARQCVGRTSNRAGSPRVRLALRRRLLNVRLCAQKRRPRVRRRSRLSMPRTRLPWRNSKRRIRGRRGTSSTDFRARRRSVSRWSARSPGWTSNSRRRSV